MANPVYVTYTSSGIQTGVSLNYFQTPFNATVGTYLSTGSTATYAIQYTLDDITAGTSASTVLPVRWYDSANYATGTTSAGTENFMFPVRAVRLNIAALSSYIEFKVLQGM